MRHDIFRFLPHRLQTNSFAITIHGDHDLSIKIDIQLLAHEDELQLVSYTTKDDTVVGSIDIFKEMDVLFAALAPFKLQEALFTFITLKPNLTITFSVERAARIRLENADSGDGLAELERIFKSV